jgi:hypothetical protein|tara:strand:+ start:1592 stop:1801 length:210 start_codon:yes stop_codon:yes gene_type:complete
MDEELVMASDYYYTTGENAGQPKPGTSPETSNTPPSPDLPDGIAPKPDDFESVPYEHDPVTNSWVAMIR